MTINLNKLKNVSLTQKIVLIFFCSAMSNGSYAVEGTKDGRMGTACFSILERVVNLEKPKLKKNENLCEAKIVQLIVRPENFHGKPVVTYGTLISTGNSKLTLVDFSGSLLLKMDRETLDKYKISSGDSVRVFGRYDALDSEGLGTYDGMIKDILLVQKR